jgi:hypothetical protein
MKKEIEVGMLICTSCGKSAETLRKGLCHLCDMEQYHQKRQPDRVPDLALKTAPDKQNRPVVKQNKVNGIIQSVSRIIFILVGLIMLSFSIYYTSIYLTFFLPYWASLILSIGFITFSTFVWVAVGVLKHRKSYGMMILFIVLGVLTLAFSIATGVSSYLHNSSVKIMQDKQNSVENDNKNTMLNDIDIQIAEILEEKQSLIIERDTLINMLKGIEYGKTYKELNYRLHLKRKSIESLNIKLKELRAKRTELLKENVIVTEQTKDFFTWLGDTIGIDSNKIKVLIFLLNSILLDLISCSSFSFGLMLIKE